jgi:hypothetical protein
MYIHTCIYLQCFVMRMTIAIYCVMYSSDVIML